jgi:hypothetical protein
MIDRKIRTADPKKARELREKAARRPAGKPPVDWKARREAGQIPGLVRRVEDRAR